MPAPKRKHGADLIERLLDEPYRFQFTQLLNILLRLLRQHGVSYDDAIRDVLRFRNSLSLAFPASEVRALDIESSAPLTSAPMTRREAECALRTGALRTIRVTPAFIGLLGTAGTLPLHDTERFAERSLAGDASQHALIDVFSNRIIGLFYEAWGKYRVEHGMDVRGQDRLLPMLMALAGTRMNAAEGRARGDIAAYYCGLLGTRPVAACTVERVLSAYFGVPVRLEQFVGGWNPIPENRRSTLGTPVPVLGAGAALGVRQWRHDLRARLCIGPLDEDQVSNFLPGGKDLRALEDLVRLFALPALRYEVQLLLSPPCIKRMVLTTRAKPRRLGWDTFLTGTPGTASRPTVGTLLPSLTTRNQ
jgi:type VI secretion system protein ImpH